MSTGSMPHPVASSEGFTAPASDASVQASTTETSLTSADFRRRFTIAELEKLYELGFFDDEKDRYELIDGDLIEMARVQPPHASAINRMAREFTLGLGRTASVIAQNPMRLGPEAHTQPEPDVTIAKYRRDGYHRRHPFPDDIFLAVEVMESTHRYDRNVKPPKHVSAGIPETWLIDLPGQNIEVYRRPVDGKYLDRTILRPGDTISSGAFPELVLDVSEILGLVEDENES